MQSGIASVSLIAGCEESILCQEFGNLVRTYGTPGNVLLGWGFNNRVNSTVKYIRTHQQRQNRRATHGLWPNHRVEQYHRIAQLGHQISQASHSVWREKRWSKSYARSPGLSGGAARAVSASCVTKKRTTAFMTG